jgi:DNA-directed RNA polymerase sigma subunit (sigma70/sigma32)
VQQPQNEPIPLLDPIARAMSKAAQREGKDQLPKIQKLLRTLNDREEDVLRRRFGIEPEQLPPDAQTILRIFGPVYDDPANDDKR